MKKLFTLFCISLSTLFCISLSLMSRAQVVFDFTTASPTSGVVSNSLVSAVIQGNNNGTTTLISATSPSGSYAGASGGNNAAVAIKTGSINPAPGGTTYFETTITPSTGYKIVLTGVNTGHTSTMNGPTVLSLRSSIDGYMSDLSTASVNFGVPWTLVTFSGISLTAGVDVPVTLRIYGSVGLGSTNTANWRIDDLKITYTSTLGVVPVTISSFTGSYTNKASFLRWTTENEINISKYTVERSTDGRTFNEIGFVNANGSHEYTFTDATAKTLINFYRLKITGPGELKYTGVVKVLSDVFAGKVNLYPSPAVNNLNAEFVSDDNQIANIMMADMTGKTLLQKTITVQKGYNNLNLDVSVLNKGIYILKILIGNKIITTPFNKL